MKKSLLTATLLTACGLVLAKLPPPDDAAKAKAAEAAAKAAWQGKVDAYQLCKAQDRVVAAYRKGGGAAAVPASGVKTVAVQPAAPVKPASAAVAATPAMPAASAAKPGASAATGAVTPVAAVAPTPCSDPGPFAYTPPDQKPLETSGAHSPAGTATSPPSVNATSGQMAPAKK